MMLLDTIRHISAKFKHDYSSSLNEMLEDITKFPPMFPSLNI